MSLEHDSNDEQNSGMFLHYRPFETYNTKTTFSIRDRNVKHICKIPKY